MAAPTTTRVLLTMADCDHCRATGERTVPAWQAEIMGEGTVECPECKGRGQVPVTVPLPEDWEDEPRD